MSYTTFAYSNLAVPQQIEAGGIVTLSVDVTNTGQHDGDEVVHLYVSHPAMKEGPIRTLQGCQRIHLKAGETQTVHFEVRPGHLALYHPEHRMHVPEGTVAFSIGGRQPGERAIAQGNVVVLQAMVKGEYNKVW